MIITADNLIMPVDLAVAPAETLRVVVRAVRRPSARDMLIAAELRGAPEPELRLLEEAAIAALVSSRRAAIRDGLPLSSGERAQFERDRELLRRFPADRAGAAGEGWFHLV